MVSPPTRSGKNALGVLLLEGLSIPTLTARDAGRRGDHGRQGAAAQGTATVGMAAANVAATGIKGYRSPRAAHQNPFHRVHSGNAIVNPNRTVVWGATGAFWR